MNTNDILLTIFIILIFVGLNFINIFAVGVKKIEENWPLYRCNPAVMPLAGLFNQDVTQNFTHCIQNMQTLSMDKFLKPFNYSQSIMGDTIGKISNSVQAVRGMFNKIRTFISEIVSSIMSVFLNIMVSLQQLIMSVMDLFSKVVGVVVVIASIMTGSNHFSSSVWNGPPGKTLRAIGSICFDENTLIQKENGEIVSMKELKLGDKLKNGSEIKGKMCLLNRLEDGYIDELYSIKGGENKSKIIVSGSHLIYDKNIKNFIQVKNYNKAKKCDYNLDQLYCLITSDHTIPLGNYIFHDWEDNNGSISKNIC